MDSYDVRFWDIKKLGNGGTARFRVRWAVDGREHCSRSRPAPSPAADPRDAQIARLRKEKAKLEQELAKARCVVDVQSKLQALLGTISESADTEPGSTS